MLVAAISGGAAIPPMTGAVATSTGNFHTAMFLNRKDPEQSRAVGKVVHDMMHRALEMEGTVSGEHAIGIGKKVRLNHFLLHSLFELTRPGLSRR